MDLKYKPSSTIVGIPKTHYNNSLENFDNFYTKDFYDELEKIANQIIEGRFKHTYLILCGSPGSGKSHYLVGVYKALVNKLGYIHGDGALFITFGEFMTEMIVRFGKEVHSMRELLVDYWSSAWLFLDDITSTERVFKADSMESTVFRDTLIERWDNSKYLAFTSNFTREDLIKFITNTYGSYVASRVISSAIILEFPKKDFRFVKNRNSK